MFTYVLAILLLLFVKKAKMINQKSKDDLATCQTKMSCSSRTLRHIEDPTKRKMRSHIFFFYFLLLFFSFRQMNCQYRSMMFSTPPFCCRLRWFY